MTNIRAKDVFYKHKTPVDYSFYEARFDEIMDIQEMSNIARVVFVVTLKLAMDDAYEQGRKSNGD